MAGGDGVVDVGRRRAGADDQALEVAAGDAGDVRRQAGGVAVDVLAVARGDGQRAGGGAIGNGDVALVGVDGGDAVRGVRQRGGEHVVGAGALIHRRGGEVDGGGVTVSLTLAVAVPVPTTRLSKPPPETPVMCAVRLEASL